MSVIPELRQRVATILEDPGLDFQPDLSIAHAYKLILWWLERGKNRDYEIYTRDGMARCILTQADAKPPHNTLDWWDAEAMIFGGEVKAAQCQAVCEAVLKAFWRRK